MKKHRICNLFNKEDENYAENGSGQKFEIIYMDEWTLGF